MVEVERHLLKSSCPIRPAQAESPREGCPGLYKELHEKAVQCAQLSQKNPNKIPGDFQ